MEPFDFSDPAYQATVAELLDSVEEVYGAVDRRLRAKLPIYERAVSTDALQESIRVNLELTTHVLRTGKEAPPRDVLTELDTIIGERIQTGVRTEEMIQGHNVVMGEILRRFIELGERRELAVAVTLESSQLLWRASNVVLQRSTSLMQQRMIDRAMREQSMRNEFVRALMVGTLRGQALEGEALTHRLDPELNYHALRARPRRVSDLEGLCRSLQEGASCAGKRGLVSILGRDCVGVVPAVARDGVWGERDASVALGPPVPLFDMSSSFQAAGRILNWMLRRAESRTRDSTDLSWRLLVDDAPDVNAQLRATYLDALDGDATLGPLIEASLRAYLTHDRNVALTATTLMVHPNTLRYRLRRYAEMTGVNLDSTDDIIGLVWALEAKRAVVATDNSDV